MNQIGIECQNCDIISKSDNGYCEHCGYKMFGPRRNEIQPSKMYSQSHGESSNLKEAKA